MSESNRRRIEDVNVRLGRRVRVLEERVRTGFSVGYCVPVYTGDDLTGVGVWETSAQAVKTFTSTLTYTGDDLTSVSTLDEKSGQTLLKTLTYSGDNLATVEVTVV